MLVEPRDAAGRRDPALGAGHSAVLPARRRLLQRSTSSRRRCSGACCRCRSADVPELQTLPPIRTLICMGRRPRFPRDLAAGRSPAAAAAIRPSTGSTPSACWSSASASPRCGPRWIVGGRARCRLRHVVQAVRPVRAGTTMVSYGMVKAVPMQMPSPRSGPAARAVWILLADGRALGIGRRVTRV